MKNYERIKNMSIDEMAEFIQYVQSTTLRCLCYSDICEGFGGKPCIPGIKQWLESEEL